MQSFRLYAIGGQSVVPMRRYDGIVQKLKWNVSIREMGRLPSLKKHSFGDNNSAASLSRS